VEAVVVVADAVAVADAAVTKQNIFLFNLKQSP
jgi:hypothetical protein